MNISEIKFSFVIPVFNRPQEVLELLESFNKQTKKDFEVVIVEDGSTETCEEVVKQFSTKLTISYFMKENSGPGDSRNYGMKHAFGNYFLILDSDCILPADYLENVYDALSQNYVDCFGGVDTAHDSFTTIQKAINFAMTSVLTTGGVRGASEKLGKFQPRSFNMGISKDAFLKSGGFSEIHPGEDPDLSFRLWELDYQTRLFDQVKVFHKRRIDWKKFKVQVHKFGLVRPILNTWYPKYAKLTYFFPLAFLITMLLSIVLTFVGCFVFLELFLFYFIICFVISSLHNNSIRVGVYAVWAILIQFYGYGTGFLKSFIQIQVLKKDPRKVYPKLFFIKNNQL